MALSTTLDVTKQFNANSGYIADFSGWDYCVVQLVSPSGAVSFNTSNDSGAVQGVSDGSSISASNFTAVQGTNLASGSAITSLNATGNVRFGYIGRYLQLTGSSVTATKVILFFTKIG